MELNYTEIAARAVAYAKQKNSTTQNRASKKWKKSWDPIMTT